MKSWLFWLSGILQTWSTSAPSASRLVFAGVFAAAAAAFLFSVILVLIRRGPTPMVRIVLTVLVSVLAALTLAGLADISVFLVSWLSYQGL